MSIFVTFLMAPQLVLALSITFEERMSKRILKAPVLVILWCGVLDVFCCGFGFLCFGFFSPCKTVKPELNPSSCSLTVIFLSV